MSYGVGTRVGVSAAIAALLSLSSGASGGGAAVTTYATWNPLDKGSAVTLSNTNLTWSSPSFSNGSARATVGKSTGKWYWEITPSSGNTLQNGIATASVALTSELWSLTGIVIYRSDGAVMRDTTLLATGLATYTSGDVIGMAFDAGGGTLAFYKNNTLIYTATGISAATYYPAIGQGSASPATATANFGASSFTYTPPAGYNAGFYTSSTDVNFVAWDSGYRGNGVTLSNNNTTMVSTIGAVLSTCNIGSGKWYWENTINSATAMVGIAQRDFTINSAYVGAAANSVGYNQNGPVYQNAATTAGNASFTTNDIIGIALDMDNGVISFYKNGVLQPVTKTGLTGIYCPAAGNSGSQTVTANFGATAFAYSVPTGYSRLATLYTAPSNTATWNPADKGSAVTLSNGNLRTLCVGISGSAARATIGKSTGAWYFEITGDSAAGGVLGMVGVGTATASIANGLNAVTGWSSYSNDSSTPSLNSYQYITGTNSTAVTSLGLSDVIGVAFDPVNGVIKYYKNGILSATWTGITTGTWYPGVSSTPSTTNISIVNFGALPFIYTPPAGYTAGVY